MKGVAILTVKGVAVKSYTDNPFFLSLKFKQWLSTFLWPLSELKRRSFMTQRELKQMSREHIVWD